VAIAGVKPAPGEPPIALPATRDVEDVRDRLGAGRLARFALGSLAGAAFIPVALWFRLRARLRR
jgi:hypothetical protein